MKYCLQKGGFYGGPMYQKGGYYSGPLYQRGGSIRGYAGPEYRMGGKWAFGSFLWRHAKPLLSFLGKQALTTGVDIGKDVLEGKNVKQAARDRITETGKNIATTAIDRVKRKIQSGKGRKKRTGKKKPSVSRKTAATTARRKKRSVKKTPSKRPRRKRSTRGKRRRSKKKPAIKTIFD